MPKTRRILVTVAVLVYAALLIRYQAFAVGGSDSSGYFNAARLLSEGRLKIRVTPLDVMGLDDSWRVHFLPLGFAQAKEPRTFAPSYPLGYPLHLLPFGVIGGWNHAPHYVTPLAVLLTLLAFYKLARELGVPEGLALGGTAALAISPGWAFQALQPMSDILAAMWCTVVMLWAVRSNRGWKWAAACGVAFSIAVWVRPSNLLLALAIGFAMRWRWRPLAIAIGASMPLAIALMLTNRSMYGSGLLTGYGGIGGLMTWGSCAPHHALWLAITMTPLVFPGGLFVAIDRQVERWRRATLLAWFIPFFAFYSAYAICDAWWYLRFLLPAYPPILIGALLLARDFVPRRHVRIALVAIVLITGMVIIHHDRLRDLYDGQRTDMHAIHWAHKVLPPNALVATMQMSGAYYFYEKELTVRYDLLEPDRFQELRAYAGNAGLKWYALVYDWEEKRLEAHMPGTWTKIGGVRNAELLRLDDR